MPTFDQFPSSSLIKALYLGDSGAGKTGSLCSLAAAGYNVRVLDLDNGVELIKDFVTNPTSPYLRPNPPLWNGDAKQVAKRISYVTITETFSILQGKPVAKGDSWAKINRQLDNWVDGDTKLGNIGTWTSNDVLVIDGLSKLSKAAMSFQVAMNGRALTRPEQMDWYQAQELIDKFLQLLQGTGTPCHVIVICHIDYIEKDDGLTRGFPQTIGKALSPRIPQSFNHTFLARAQGQGQAVRRKILTNTVGTVDLKNTAPLRVKPEYELATGLAEYWRDVQGDQSKTK